MIKLQAGYIMARIEIKKQTKKEKEAKKPIEARLFVHRTNAGSVSIGEELLLTERATGTKVQENKKDYFITHIDNICATK